MNILVINEETKSIVISESGARGPAGATGSGAWGTITGDILTQADLQALIDLKLEPKIDINASYLIEHDDQAGGFNYISRNFNVEPLQNSPNESWNMHNIQVQIDPNSSGFTLGTSGTFGTIFNLGFTHQGTSDVGNFGYFNTYSNIGNGTDPINVKGFQAILGFGNINANVTIEDSFQGYGFQWAIDAGATINGYITGFYDSMNISCAVGSYSSFQASPTIANVKTNNQVVGLNLNPNISEFTGNAGYTGIGIAGQFGSTALGASSGMNGININPTISNFGVGNYYNGIYSSVSNITGVGTNKWAGYFDGNVNITGNLTFGGALSIGQLNAFASFNTVDGGGNPSTIHGLITQVTALTGTTNNFDYIGVNTASLFTAQAGAISVSGPLGLGANSLALPMVVETHTGSDTDVLCGATFAINLSGTSTGGTVGQIYGGRSVMIPNGITTVDRCYGWLADSPFGLVATDNWGFYSKDYLKNYMQGALVIGVSDNPTNSSVGLELNSTTQAILNPRMTTTERNALTAVNGMQIYNSTDNKLQVYASGSWVDLH